LFIPVQSPLAPQNVGLVWGLTQVVPQMICPGSQLGLQAPSVQTVPAPQAIPPVQVLPDAPQFVLSLCGLMHLPPQRTCPVVQTTVQELATHVCPVLVEHWIPAVPPSTPHEPVAPQYLSFVVGSMQPPLQSTSGAVHEP
jgi:hypothetical protein